MQQRIKYTSKWRRQLYMFSCLAGKTLILFLTCRSLNFSLVGYHPSSWSMHGHNSKNLSKHFWMKAKAWRCHNFCPYPPCTGSRNFHEIGKVRPAVWVESVAEIRISFAFAQVILCYTFINCLIETQRFIPIRPIPKH